MVQSFVPPFSQAEFDDLRQRLRQTRWPEMADEQASTSLGVNRSFLMDLCDYWIHNFDWKKQLSYIEALHHFRFRASECDIHFIHERGQGASPMPLVLTHGWPGSFVEMIKIIPNLTDPASYGHDASDSFDVIAPSLPGFGYSDKPKHLGMNYFRIAELWCELMGGLGYARFGAQGGDIGAGISTALGLRHADRIVGIHLNYIPGSYYPFVPEGEATSRLEQEFLAEAAKWSSENGAYAHLQGTRPNTAAYALNDSPVGLAAWIVEKFQEWSYCGGDVYRRFTRDELLTNITVYWMTQTIASSFRIYHEGRKAPLRLGAEDFVRPPCAIAHFPKEIMFPPREWVERGYNVQRWTEMPRGGHFAAAEEPELLADDIRAFFRPLRQAMKRQWS